MRDFQKIDINEFSAFGDSILAIEHETKNLIEFPKSKVEKVVLWNRSKGVGQAASAGAIGLASFWYLTSPDNWQDALGSKEVAAMLGFIYGGVLGVPVGFLIGSNDNYVFSPHQINEMADKDSLDKLGVGQNERRNYEELKDVVKKEMEMREQMVANSGQPVKPTKYYLSMELGYGFGSMPILDHPNLDISNDGAGSGSSSNYLFGFAITPDFYLGLSGGGYSNIQTTGDITTRRNLSNFSLTARQYARGKNYYYRGALGYSQFDERSTLFYPEVELDNTSISGMRVMIGVGTSIIRGKKYEIHLGGDVSINYFDAGMTAVRSGFNIGITGPRRIVK